MRTYRIKLLQIAMDMWSVGCVLYELSAVVTQ